MFIIVVCVVGEDTCQSQDMTEPSRKEEMKENKITFKRAVGNKGGVLGISIPPELLTYLKLENGDTVAMIPERGKHGAYIALWKTKP